jgi:large subunit ribosomal protein L22
MPGVKTNEVPGTRAVLRHYRMSATKARQVLDLVRGKEVDRAGDILASTPREGARVVAKVLASAVANARNNDLLDPDDLYVSACYADEGTTIKRWRPRARGRATRIRKRTCHITVIVSRLPDDRLEHRRARQAVQTTAVRSRRVAASRRERGAATEESAPATKDETPVATEDDVEPVDDVEAAADDETAEETTADDGETTESADEAEAEAPEAEVAEDESAPADAEEKD